MGRHATMLAGAILACLVTAACGHTTFKLPAAPGVPGVALYPNTAPSGGYGARCRATHACADSCEHSAARWQENTRAIAVARSPSAPKGSRSPVP